MNVEFISGDPRRKSRPLLDDVLRRGVDQLAIACAFCTAAGIEILMQHVERIGNPGSFVVVSVAPPTDYSALAQLHSAIPGNLFVHWGALLPAEIKGGAALMHSKVFYARSGRECWLWTGSHNLTGLATQGGNCEASVILNGTVDEQPFVDALQHLVACKNESKPYDPDEPSPNVTKRADVVVIHAETDSVPTDPLPWHVHLCLETSDFDELLGPPADVRLFLYPRGALGRGWQHVMPIAAFEGALTGQNLTNANPRTRRAGIPAEWRDADFGITESDGIPVVGRTGPPGRSVATQVLLHIEAASDPTEMLFSEKPRVESKRTTGNEWCSQVDPDMRTFFQADSIRGTELIHVPYNGRERVLRIGDDDIRNSDLERIRSMLNPNDRGSTELSLISEPRKGRRHPFIIRAKYRLRGDEQ